MHWKIIWKSIIIFTVYFALANFYKTVYANGKVERYERKSYKIMEWPQYKRL